MGLLSGFWIKIQRRNRPPGSLTHWHTSLLELCPLLTCSLPRPQTWQPCWGGMGMVFLIAAPPGPLTLPRRPPASCACSHSWQAGILPPLPALILGEVRACGSAAPALGRSQVSHSLSPSHPRPAHHGHPCTGSLPQACTLLRSALPCPAQDLCSRPGVSGPRAFPTFPALHLSSLLSHLGLVVPLLNTLSTPSNGLCLLILARHSLQAPER